MDDKPNFVSGSILCPECYTPQIIDEVRLGKVVECPACGTESEVVTVDPLKLSPLEEEK